MENLTLKINKIKPITKKTGKLVKGISNNGIAWQMFEINGKYTMFCYGGEEPDLTLGETYDFDLEQKQTGEYLNQTITLKRIPEEPKPLNHQNIEAPPTNGNQIIMDEIQAIGNKINERLDRMGEFLSDRLPKK